MNTSTTPMSREPGFWRLQHDDLAAALAPRDLSGEELRVYLAVADLTLGFGKDRDEVSLGQIAKLTRMDRPHVVRALRGLAKAELYRQTEAGKQSVIREVIWPAPPVVRAGTVANAVAVAGNSGVAKAGNRSVAKGVARAGTHQDSKNSRKGKKPKTAAGKRPRDPRVTPFRSFFSELYEKELGRPYIPSCGSSDPYGAEGKLIKGLLVRLDGKTICAMAELKRAARNMLADTWGREKADIGLLSSKLNSWLGNGQKPKGKGAYLPAAAGAMSYDRLGQRFGDSNGE